MLPAGLLLGTELVITREFVSEGEAESIIDCTAVRKFSSALEGISTFVCE